LIRFVSASLAVAAVLVAAGVAFLDVGQDERSGPGARGLSGDASAPSGTEPARRAPSAADLARAVSVPGMIEHLRALQRIAARHGGNRAAATSGGRASVRYVARRLRAAGYRVRLQPVPAGDGVGPTQNVLADLPGARARSTVIAGGHLDSVPEGPGINDNGSGVAALLEIAEQLARLDVRQGRSLRFAFWGKEERGHLGSLHYVERLSRRRRSRIAAYVNLDMVGSRNGGYFFYGGGESARDRRVVAAIERTVRRRLRSRGVPLAETSLEGLSDHSSFAPAGVPVAGLYSGSNEMKTRRQARGWGGRSGEAFDPCYHRPCDRLRGVDRRVLGRLADAAAVAVHGLATRRVP
jgi:aminopeptidase S